MADQLYQKYGAGDTRGMGETLQAGINAQKTNFKDVLKGVEDLAGTVEKKYIEDNTLKVQDYLRNNIKQAGLSADAPDITQVSAQFGKLIDKDTLGKVITDTRAKMLDEVDNKAVSEFGSVFGTTRDISKATNAYQKSLEAEGIKPNQALAMSNKMYNDSKPLVERIDNTNKLAELEAKTNLMTALNKDPNLGHPEAIELATKDLDPRVKEDVKLRFKNELNERSKATDMQKEEMDAVFQVGARDLETLKLKKADADGKYTAAAEQYNRYLSPGIKEGLSKIDSKTGAGWADVIRGKAESYFGGLFGKVDGDGIVKELAPQIQDLVNSGLGYDEAVGAAMQGWQATRSEQGTSIVAPDGVWPSKLRENVHAIGTNLLQSKKVMQEHAAMQSEALRNMISLQGKIDAATSAVKKGERLESITGKSSDAKKIWGSNYQYTEPQKPVETVKGETGKKVEKVDPVTPTSLFKKSLIESTAAKSKTTVTAPVIKSDGKPAVGATGDWGANAPDTPPTEKSYLKRFTELFTGPGNANASTVDVRSQRANAAKIKNTLQTITDISSPDVEAKMLKEAVEGQKVKVHLNGSTVYATKKGNKFIYTKIGK